MEKKFFEKSKEEQLREFFKLIVGLDGYLEIRRIKDKKVIGENKFYPGKYIPIKEILEMRETNVYFGVCPRIKPGAGKEEDILKLNCFWADLDEYSKKTKRNSQERS